MRIHLKTPLFCTSLVSGVTALLLVASSSAFAWGHYVGYAVAGFAGHEMGRAYDEYHAQSAISKRDLPDASITPGATDPAVTQDNIGYTICRRGGYTGSVRPGMAYTEDLKRRQISQYGYADHRMGDYEEDHLIPLELGGAPSDTRNLWPQPHRAESGMGSFQKDELENRLHDLVCGRKVSLNEAQRAIAADWVSAYRKYVGR